MTTTTERRRFYSVALSSSFSYDCLFINFFFLLFSHSFQVQIHYEFGGHEIRHVVKKKICFSIRSLIVSFSLWISLFMFAVPSFRLVLSLSVVIVIELYVCSDTNTCWSISDISRVHCIRWSKHIEILWYWFCLFDFLHLLSPTFANSQFATFSLMAGQCYLSLSSITLISINAVRSATPWQDTAQYWICWHSQDSGNCLLFSMK